LLCGSLRRADGALLRLDGCKSGSELRVALLLAIARLLNYGVLGGQSFGELLGIMAG
jgi:hypothetical protein